MSGGSARSSEMKRQREGAADEAVERDLLPQRAIQCLQGAHHHRQAPLGPVELGQVSCQCFKPDLFSIHTECVNPGRLADDHGYRRDPAKDMAQAADAA